MYEYKTMEEQYLELLAEVMADGYMKRPARPDMPYTKELFGRVLRCNLNQEFPLLTTKKMPIRTILIEMLWILSGDTNVKTLINQGVEIWTEYAYKYYLKSHKYVKGKKLSFEDWYRELKSDSNTRLGSCGKIYGKQWRSFGYGHKFDQIKNVIKSIKTAPSSRYHIVSAWDPVSFLMLPDRAALPSCPAFMQFSVRGQYLDLSLTQRSADMFLGVPFDLASYAALVHVIAKLTGYEPGEFIWFGNSVHIYKNHFEVVEEQLKRFPKRMVRLELTGPCEKLEDFTVDSFVIKDYTSHGRLSGALAVGS